MAKFPLVNFNTERIYQQYVLDGGCELWVPLASEEQGEIMKVRVLQFIDEQITEKI